jgi:hypothetical protein
MKLDKSEINCLLFYKKNRIIYDTISCPYQLQLIKKNSITFKFVTLYIMFDF